MKKGIWIDALKLVALFGILWAAFMYLPIHNPFKDKFTVSLDTEEKIGKALSDAVTESNTQLNNKTIDTAIAIITNRLVANIGPTDFNYHFYVLDDKRINAFTLPGGNIFIYSGMIKFCNSPEELAAVIAHEIGHAEKRHSIDRLEKEVGLTVLFSVLTGGNSSVLNKLSRSATSAVFDRKQEAEADAYGFHLLDKSGIDPSAFATLFQRINDEQGTNSLDFEILRTHPDNNSRIKAAEEYKLGKDFKNRPININWERVKLAMKVADTI